MKNVDIKQVGDKTQIDIYIDTRDKNYKETFKLIKPLIDKYIRDDSFKPSKTLKKHLNLSDDEFIGFIDLYVDTYDKDSSYEDIKYLMILIVCNEKILKGMTRVYIEKLTKLLNKDQINDLFEEDIKMLKDLAYEIIYDKPDIHFKFKCVGLVFLKCVLMGFNSKKLGLMKGKIDIIMSLYRSYYPIKYMNDTILGLNSGCTCDQIITLERAIKDLKICQTKITEDEYNRFSNILNKKSFDLFNKRCPKCRK